MDDGNLISQKIEKLDKKLVFCVTCQEKVKPNNPKIVPVKTNRWGIKGECPHCKKGVFTFFKKKKEKQDKKLSC